MGSKIKMFGEKEKATRVKKKPAGGIGNPFKKSAQYRVVVKAEPYHGIGSRVHGEWYR